MISILDTPYKSLILHTIYLPIGKLYLLKDCVVSELYFEVIGTAQHASEALQLCLDYYGTYDVIKKRIWIANRTQKYSIQPVAWIRLKKEATQYLKGYCVVDTTKYGIMNAILESKFVPINFKNATTLDEAMQWTQEIMSDQESA
ncbi:hypothetical protein [Nonlabens ponticola]|uniref:STAS/SEC14 domain-containing protein n=1 Tax=Nonlabens ponticola TaxID=2496866 RepID=A0A3S9MVY4_9FLAO|nr:hypothetical protein [Nonlabens ponticola]AZQ43386.1 hypothetical protein EJ995_03720 [Nonlabens ponticola]